MLSPARMLLRWEQMRIAVPAVGSRGLGAAPSRGGPPPGGSGGLTPAAALQSGFSPPSRSVSEDWVDIRAGRAWRDARGTLPGPWGRGEWVLGGHLAHLGSLPSSLGQFPHL